MKAEEFDRLFDEGADVTGLLDLSGATRSEHEAHHVDIAFPAWLLDKLDREANRLGISRPAMVVRWLSERSEQRDVERSRA